MSDTLWTQTLSAFRDATASDAPTPGGGSVAMVSASLGLGLVVMALEITAKKPDPGTEAALSDLLREARAVLAELSHHADRDIAVFQAYMAALKLPKATDEEKASRKSAMEDALRDATEAPLSAARACVQALVLAGRAAELSSVRVISDVGAGAALLQGATTAVLLNVDINLPGIKKPDLSVLNGNWSEGRRRPNEEAASRHHEKSLLHSEQKRYVEWRTHSARKTDFPVLVRMPFPRFLSPFIILTTARFLIANREAVWRRRQNLPQPSAATVPLTAKDAR